MYVGITRSDVDNGVVLFAPDPAEADTGYATEEARNAVCHEWMHDSQAVEAAHN